MYLDTQPQGKPEPSRERDAPAILHPWQRILLDAAALLERDGWCQHAMHDKGRHCTVGAIGVVGNFMENAYVARDRFRAAIGGCNVPQWNDSPERTQEEVVAKLRAVALGG